MGEKRSFRERLRLGERLRTSRGKMSMFAVGGVVAGVVLGGAAMELIDQTDSPEFCNSCHIMDSAFGSFQESNHAHLDCNDCHAPTDDLLIVKLSFKARAGAGHVYYNTIGRGSIPDVLHATTDSVQVVNDNCVSCHEPTVQEVNHTSKENCADCHRSVPHGRGMYRPDEWHEPAHPGVPTAQTAAEQS